MQPKIYLYSRVSDESQLEGHGKERQTDNNMSEALELSRETGLPIAEAISDDGVSAWKGHNLHADAGLGGFFHSVETGKIAPDSWMVVDEWSRLTRLGEDEAIDMMRRFKRGKIHLSANRQRYRHDAKGMSNVVGMISAILNGANDSEYMRKMVKNVTAAWHAKQAKDEIMTAMVVKWCRCEVLGKNNRKIHLIPERAEIVRDIYNWYLQGDGFTVIANRLNDMKVPTWGNGRQWNISYIGEIITNKAATGVMITNRRKTKDLQREIPDYYPRVISDEDFAAAQRLRTQRRNHEFAGRTGKYVNALRGLAKCAGCGNSLYFMDSGKKYTSLMCKTHGCGNYRKQWKYEFILDAILEEVNESVWLDADPVVIDRSQELAIAQAKLEELRAEQKKAMDMVLKSSNTMQEAWLQVAEEKSAQAAILDRDIEDLKATVQQDEGKAKAWTSSTGEWKARENMTPEQIRQNLRNLLSGVVVDCAEKTFRLRWALQTAAA